MRRKEKKKRKKMTNNKSGLLGISESVSLSGPGIPDRL